MDLFDPFDNHVEVMGTQQPVLDPFSWNKDSQPAGDVLDVSSTPVEAPLSENTIYGNLGIYPSLSNGTSDAVLTGVDPHDSFKDLDKATEINSAGFSSNFENEYSFDKQIDSGSNEIFQEDEYDFQTTDQAGRGDQKIDTTCEPIVTHNTPSEAFKHDDAPDAATISSTNNKVISYIVLISVTINHLTNNNTLSYWSGPPSICM